MVVISSSVRLLHPLPALSSTAILMFALDEPLIFGTWMHPALHERANANPPYGGHTGAFAGAGLSSSAIL